MFAAAAIVGEMLMNGGIAFARWLATKAFIIACMAIILPWVLKGVLSWAFEWIVAYGMEFFDYIMTFIRSMAGDANIDIDINLTGVGGYFAVQTGLLDYASIIFTGWGIYWIIAILAKTPKAVL